MKNDRKSNNPDMLQKMLRQVRDVFLDELPDRLDKLDNLLLAIEKRGAATEEEFNELYGGVHSIKGSGGTHGLHIISTICHQFEDQLNSVAGHLSELPREAIDSGLDYVGLLRTAMDQVRRGLDTFPEIEKKLLELHGRVFAVKYSVLLVDGSRFSSKVYAQALSDLPVHTVVIENGYTALLRILTEPFDILITSLEVPVLNGKALIGALRLSSSPNRKIGTILLTSNPELEKSKQGETDANHVIVKDPSLAANLHDTVKQIIADIGKKAAPNSL